MEQWPADVAAGRDPQLEKAVEVVMAELKKNPPKNASTARTAKQEKAVRRTPFRRSE